MDSTQARLQLQVEAGEDLYCKKGCAKGVEHFMAYIVYPSPYRKYLRCVCSGRSPCKNAFNLLLLGGLEASVTLRLLDAFACFARLFFLFLSARLRAHRQPQNVKAIPYDP